MIPTCTHKIQMCSDGDCSTKQCPNRPNSAEITRETVGVGSTGNGPTDMH